MKGVVNMFHLDPTRRHDFMLLFDAEKTNPNGDPDAGNLPRVDPENMRGFTTDVMIKRKVRDYLQLTYGIPMFIQSETALNRLIYRAARDSGAGVPELTLTDSYEDKLLAELLSQKEIENIEYDEGVVCYVGESSKPKEIQQALKADKADITDDDLQALVEALADDYDFKQKPPTKNEVESALKSLAARLCESIKGKGKLDKDVRDKTKDKMIEHYFDIRMFGAVLSTGLNAGQVRGPMQLTFAKSMDPIFRMDCGITRKAVTREADRKSKENSMGRKPIVNYGLYQGSGHYSPYLAQKTPKCEISSDNIFVSKRDLELFWEALWMGFENDHSASRHIRPRGVYVFTHSNPRGNAPSHRLFKMLEVALKEEVIAEERMASNFLDYKVTLPEGVLEIGENKVRIIAADADEIKSNAGIPENSVIFTKVYHE
jgi:CRISPR-associated protein Csd2